MTKEEKKALAERIGAWYDGDNKIFVSELGIVSGVDEHGYTKEEPFDNFAKKIDTGIKYGKSLVRYDKETNKFYLIDIDKSGSAKKVHELDVNKKTMEDYAFGNYDRTTLILHNLCLKSDDKSAIISREKADEKTKNAIIAKANNSHEQLSPLEARIYLDYLQDLNKENAKTAAKEAGKITALAGTPLAGGVTLGVLKGTAIVGTAAGLGPAILVGVLGVGMTAIMEELVYVCKNIFTDDFNSYDFVFSYVKDAYDKLKEKIEDIKVNRVKQKYLKNIENIDKIVMPESVTIEEAPAKPLDLEDNIMSEINSLVDKAAFINPEDRGVFLDEAKTLLNTYIDRSRSIINQGKSAMDPDADNLVNLRIDVCKQLAKMEMRLNEVRERDKKHQALTEEGKLLTDKITEIGSIESDKTNTAIEDKWKKAEVNKMLSDDSNNLDYNDIKIAK